MMRACARQRFFASAREGVAKMQQERETVQRGTHIALRSPDNPSCNQPAASIAFRNRSPVT